MSARLDGGRDGGNHRRGRELPQRTGKIARSRGHCVIIENGAVGDWRKDDEEFNDFFDRVGKEPFEAAVQDLTLPPEFSVQTMDEFIDWDREGLYVLERGEGECAV